MNKKEQHYIQKMEIQEYIEKMQKNTYFYEECSICRKQQNLVEDKEIFKYCIKCQKTVCHDCINKHLQNNNSHFFIFNNEKNIKCLFHPNEKNKMYCYDCKAHICDICLKQCAHKMNKKLNKMEYFCPVCNTYVSKGEGFSITRKIFLS
jgi:hypothetical protein